MDENDIRELLLGRGIDFAHHATLLATLKPTVGAYHNGMGDYMNTMREHVLHLNSSGIAIIPIDDRRGKMIEDELLFIPNEKIAQLKMNMKLMSLTFTIDTEDGELVYKVRRSVLGAPWHKENLAFILLRAGAGDAQDAAAAVTVAEHEAVPREDDASHGTDA